VGEKARLAADLEADVADGLLVGKLIWEDEMAKVEVNLPDELEKQLLAIADLLNISLENLIVQSLVNSSIITSTDVDPISPLLGTLKSEVSDIGERHDFYLGQALQRELDCDE